jgi:glycosyltransferase involved in cell wall biosynthesis
MKRRLLFLSGREAGYIRNRVLLSALSTHFDVTVVTPPLPSTVLRTAIGLARVAASARRYDAYFAGFFGQPAAIALGAIQKRPIVLDAFVSTFDTLCADRQWFPAGSPLGQLARWIDARSCQVSARIITDTLAHARYFGETFAVPAAKLETVYVGCDESHFRPRPSPPAAAGGAEARFEVFYYGSFLALHGTETIVEAAALLQGHPDIHFTLGGDGPQRRRLERLVSSSRLRNVEMPGWIPFERIPDQIAGASLCLGGHFSTVPKAARVISTKTFQFLAMGKPTIVGDNPATREILVHGEHVWAVRMGDPEALAEAIATLAGDAGLCAQIAAGGRELYQQRLATSAIASQLARLVEGLVCACAS